MENNKILNSNKENIRDFHIFHVSIGTRRKKKTISF